MKSNNLFYLNLKGQKNSSINLYKDCIIQKNNIICQEYSIGYNINITELQNKADNSIYGTGLLSKTEHKQIVSNELINEVSTYGSKLYKLLKKDFNFLGIPRPIIDENIILNAINTKNSPAILEVFCSWCKNYGFPIEPIEHSYCDNEVKYYELKFEKIKNLTVQFILIYLLHTFYEDLTLIQKDKNTYDGFDDSIQIRLNRLNKFTKLFGIKIEKIDSNFFDKNETEKNKIKNIILKNIVIVLNIYAHYFNNSSENYFSYLNGKLYYQRIFTNIFDMCWEYISQNYISFKTATRECADCHTAILATTNKKYCDECSKKRNRSKECHNSKIGLMQEIIDFFFKYQEYFTDDEITNNIKSYTLIVSKKRGYSKKLEKTTKKDLTDFYEKLKLIVYHQ